MTGKITYQGITVRRGDSFPISLHFCKECRNADISGYVITMQVRDINNKLIFSKNAVADEAAEGRATILLEPSDTDIEPDTYYTDIQIKDKNGQVNTVYPSDVGKVAFFKVTGQITEE